MDASTPEWREIIRLWGVIQKLKEHTVMALTPEDLSKLASIITSKTEEYARGVVEREVGRIPYEVRTYLEHTLRTEIRQLVREAVAAAISIEVKVNG